MGFMRGGGLFVNEKSNQEEKIIRDTAQCRMNQKIFYKFAKSTNKIFTVGKGPVSAILL